MSSWEACASVTSSRGGRSQEPGSCCCVALLESADGELLGARGETKEGWGGAGPSAKGWGYKKGGREVGPGGAGSADPASVRCRVCRGQGRPCLPSLGCPRSLPLARARTPLACWHAACGGAQHSRPHLRTHGLRTQARFAGLRATRADFLVEDGGGRLIARGRQVRRRRCRLLLHLAILLRVLSTVAPCLETDPPQACLLLDAWTAESACDDAGTRQGEIRG